METEFDLFSICIIFITKNKPTLISNCTRTGNGHLNGLSRRSREHDSYEKGQVNLRIICLQRKKNLLICNILVVWLRSIGIGSNVFLFCASFILNI